MFVPAQPLILEEPAVELGPGAHPLAVTARLRQGDRVATMHFRFTNAAPEPPALGVGMLLPLALVPAMKLGAPLRAGGGIDRSILQGADQFQEIFSAWYRDFQRVPIDADEAAVDVRGEDGRGVGVFFSGGLDSMYTLRKHRDEITHAIFVHGCDVPLDNRQFRERTSARLQEAARSFGIELIEVETDLLEFSDRYSHWGYHYHGCALSAIAMMLSGSLRKVFIASSDPFMAIVPWGSSYLTDPLWSSPPMEIVHDGCEHDRLGKTGVLAEDELALRYLRVCFENPREGLNCGRCEKCYRTMVGLRLFGGLDRCPAFNEPLDLGRMVASEETLKAAGKMRAWTIYREAAERNGDDPELIAALAELFRRSSFHQTVRRFAQEKADLTASPDWRESLPKFRTRLFESLRENDPDWLAERILKHLPEFRDQAFDRLWEFDRRWFERRYLKARWSRLGAKLRGDKKK